MKGWSTFPQSSSITGTSPSDCYVSYPGHSLTGGLYSSVEKQSVYSTAPADWARVLGVLPIYERYSRRIPLHADKTKKREKSDCSAMKKKNDVNSLQFSSLHNYRKERS